MINRAYRKNLSYGIKDRITRLRKLDDWFRVLARYRDPECALIAATGQAITKLWLTMSNYKVRYYGDGLITRAITRVLSLSSSLSSSTLISACARAHSREWKCASSWHAINPDPIANPDFAFITRALRNFIDVRRVHYFARETANETL